jgi:hypothetical protein
MKPTILLTTYETACVRAERFDAYAEHSMLGKRHAEIIKAGDLAWSHAFIAEHAALSIDEFAAKVVRISIMANKPKSWAAIEELLICACSALRIQP